MALKVKRLHSSLYALQAARERVEKLRATVIAERTQLLKKLHVDLGFASRPELVEALRQLDGGRRAMAPSAPTSSTPARSRKRTRITPEMRTDIIEAVKAGQAGAAVAEHFGISVQSIQNIKKAAGLVRERAK